MVYDCTQPNFAFLSFPARQTISRLHWLNQRGISFAGSIMGVRAIGTRGIVVRNGTMSLQHLVTIPMQVRLVSMMTGTQGGGYSGGIRDVPRNRVPFSPLW